MYFLHKSQTGGGNQWVAHRGPNVCGKWFYILHWDETLSEGMDDMARCLSSLQQVHILPSCNLLWPLKEWQQIVDKAALKHRTQNQHHATDPAILLISFAYIMLLKTCRCRYWYQKHSQALFFPPFFCSLSSIWERCDITKKSSNSCCQVINTN